MDTGATGNSDHVFSSMMMMRIGDYDDCGASGGGQGTGSEHSARITHIGNFFMQKQIGVVPFNLIMSALFIINSIMRILLWFHPHYRKHCHRVDDQEKPEEEGGRSANSNWI